jgi:hypothetical protein
MAFALVGATLVRPHGTEAPAAVVRATNPIISLAPTTEPVTTSTAPARTTIATTASVTTALVTDPPRTSFHLGSALTPFGGTADAWVLAPLADIEPSLAKIATALGTDRAGLDVTAGMWHFELPVTGRPVPFLCVGLDLNDPRAFPRCQQALDQARADWRGGVRAIERAAALWRSMGYDLADYQVEPKLDGDGFVVAHLLLGGTPVRFGLRLRFEDTKVQAAEGLLVAPRSVPVERTSSAEAVIELQAHGPAEVRGSDGTIDSAPSQGGSATIVAVEPALVGRDGPGPDPGPGVPADPGAGRGERRYAVPGYAFVAADGRRFVVTAVTSEPVWDPPPSAPDPSAG